MIMSEVSLEQLRAPFPKEKHGKNYGGYVYIDETAVSERLDEVDPNWSFEIVNVIIREKNVSVHARLTVCGVSRDGIGTQTVEYVKEKDDKGKVIGETDVEISEVEKGAATDALRRCARLFGIGRYLLGGAPLVAKGGDKNWSDTPAWKAFNQWYDSQFTIVRPTTQNEPAPKEEAANLILVTEIAFQMQGNKQTMKLIDDGGMFITLTTTKDFAEAGYKPKEWLENGGAHFDPALPVQYVKRGNAFSVVHIGQLDF